MDTPYKIIGGIKSYVSDVDLKIDYFPSNTFDYLFNLENENFWFISRNKILKYLFSRYLGTSKRSTIMEVGCGTGYVLRCLSEFENFELTGADIYLDALKYAQKRVPGVELVKIDATKMPF